MLDQENVFVCELGDGIHRTHEFAKKKLADYSVNVGLKCGHGCTYCSSGASLRRHRAFKKIGKSPFTNGYAVIDPEIPEKVARNAARIRNRVMVQLCTTVDAWEPAAQKYGLVRHDFVSLLLEVSGRVAFIW
jgi:DNA repair photolyase